MLYVNCIEYDYHEYDELLSSDKDTFEMICNLTTKPNPDQLVAIHNTWDKWMSYFTNGDTGFDCFDVIDDQLADIILEAEENGNNL
jgi:hypothetical protein